MIQRNFKILDPKDYRINFLVPGIHIRHSRGRLYTNKLPVTAVQVMNNNVLPYFEEHGVKVEKILADNGREYCSRPGYHPSELFL